MQLFALGGCKALLCDFSDRMLAALGVPMKVESVRETLVIFLGWICLCQVSSVHEISISGDFSGVDFVSVSDVISACDFNDTKNFH